MITYVIIFVKSLKESIEYRVRTVSSIEYRVYSIVKIRFKKEQESRKDCIELRKRKKIKNVGLTSRLSKKMFYLSN